MIINASPITMFVTPLRMTERESARSCRSRRFPIFLRLETFSGHAFRFIGREENKNVGYVGGIRPFRWIFLWLGGAMHRGVHTSGVDPVDAHAAFFQFRRPRLRHAFKAKFGNAVRTPTWITDLARIARDVNNGSAALDHRR